MIGLLWYQPQVWWCLFVSIFHPVLLFCFLFNFMAQKSDIENLPFICRPDHSFLPFFLRLIVSCTFSSLLGAKAEICGVLTSERGYFPTTLRPRKADLTTCLLNHCWKKVGPTLLCCGCESAEVEEEEEENKNDNAAAKSFHLIRLNSDLEQCRAKVHDALNPPWCTGKPAENTLSPGAHAHSGALVLLSSSHLFSPRATDGLRSSSHSGCVRASRGCTPPLGSSADLPPPPPVDARLRGPLTFWSEHSLRPRPSFWSDLWAPPQSPNPDASSVCKQTELTTELITTGL